MNKKVVQSLKKGGIGVLPTDTLYGLVGSAFSKKAVERIYKVKKRSKTKPLIILIRSVNDLKKFGVSLSEEDRWFLGGVWPGRVSIIFSQKNKRFHYLSRGSNALALRVPNRPSLLKLLKRVGPLVAPSANIEGRPVTKTIARAEKIFGDKVDFYYGGRLPEDGRASTLVRIGGGRLLVKRQGAVKIKI